EEIAHERARSIERTELLDVREVDLLGFHRLERELGARDPEARRRGQIGLADAQIADPRAVLAAEIPDPHAARRRDELGMHRRDSGVGDDELTRRVATDDDGLRADRDRARLFTFVNEATATELDRLRGKYGRRHVRLPRSLPSIRLV